MVVQRRPPTEVKVPCSDLKWLSLVVRLTDSFPINSQAAITVRQRAMFGLRPDFDVPWFVVNNVVIDVVI